MLNEKDQLARASKRIDRAAIRRYAHVSDDFNPIHVDPEFAAKTPMGGIIAHGMLSLNLIWESLRASYGETAHEGARLSVRFTRPVHENDLISASGQLSGQAGVYDVKVENQDGEIVIKGTLDLASVRPDK